MEVRYARSGDAHLAYDVVGDQGPYLVYVAPYTISIDSIDDEPHAARFTRRLASFCRLVRFDCRGIGLSDPIDPDSPLSPESIAADALAVAGAAGADRFWIWGSSGAGPAGVHLALLAGERAEGLILSNSYARLVRADDYPIGFREGLVEAFVSENTNPDVEWRGGDDLAWLAPSLQDDSAFREFWARASRRGASPRAAQQLIGANSFADVRGHLAAISVPTLVTHRRDDAFVPVAHGRYLGEHIPGARYVELPGADHIEISGDVDELLDEVELFMTGSITPAGGERVLTTVLFTDIVDSTTLAAELGDARWRERLDAHDALVREQLLRFGGREVNTTGDGFFASFDSPTRAVRCAKAVAKAAARVGTPVRAGIHTGECERRGSDLAGLAVHIAARVAAAALAEEVLVTRTVHDLVAGAGLAFEARGEHTLKGVPDAWELYAVAAGS